MDGVGKDKWFLKTHIRHRNADYKMVTQRAFLHRPSWHRFLPFADYCGRDWEQKHPYEERLAERFSGNRICSETLPRLNHVLEECKLASLPLRIDLHKPHVHSANYFARLTVSPAHHPQCCCDNESWVFPNCNFINHLLLFILLGKTYFSLCRVWFIRN